MADDAKLPATDLCMRSKRRNGSCSQKYRKLAKKKRMSFFFSTIQWRFAVQWLPRVRFGTEYSNNLYLLLFALTFITFSVSFICNAQLYFRLCCLMLLLGPLQLLLLLLIRLTSQLPYAFVVAIVDLALRLLTTLKRFFFSPFCNHWMKFK